MTLATIVDLASCLSSITIVVSLILVMRQMHLSIRHQRAAARHGRVQQLQTLYLQASQGDFVNVLIRGQAGDTGMEAPDCYRFVWFAAAIFNMFESMSDQHRDSIIDDATFASSISGMRSQLAMPGMRAAWMVIRGGYKQAYIDAIDRLMADTPVAETSDIAAAWRGFAIEAQRHAD